MSWQLQKPKLEVAVGRAEARIEEHAWPVRGATVLFLVLRAAILKRSAEWLQILGGQRLCACVCFSASIHFTSD